MTNFDEFDAESQALLNNLQQSNKFLSFKALNKGFLDKETFNSISKGFEDVSAFKKSPFGQYWEIDERQKKENNFIYNESNINTNESKKSLKPIFSLYMNKDLDSLIKYYEKGVSSKDFTVYIHIKKEANIIKYSGITNNASMHTGLKSEDIISIYGVQIGFDFLDAKLSKTDFISFAREYDLWLNPGGFLNNYQIEQIASTAYKEFQYFNDSTIIRNKIFNLFMNKLKGDLRETFDKDLLANFIKKIADELEQRLLITKETRWNAELKGYDPFINIELEIESHFQDFEKHLETIDNYFKNDEKNSKFNIEDNTFLKAFIQIYYEIKEKLIPIYHDVKSIFLLFEDIPKILNAFFVGFYNGLIHFLRNLLGAVEFIAQLINPGNWEKMINGLITFVSDFKTEFSKLIKELYTSFIEKIKNASNIYDLTKVITEEIITIVADILLIYFTGGAKALQKLKDLLKNIKKLSIDELKELFKYKSKNKVYWLSIKIFKFGDDAATFKNFLRLRERVDDGFYNVLCHGNPKRVIINGKKYSPEEFSKFLIEAGYEKGKPIRLVACETGANNNGFAAQLAKILETKVIAPTKKISLNDVGDFVHESKGKFVEF